MSDRTTLAVSVEEGGSVVLGHRYLLTVDEICEDGFNFSLRDYSDPDLPQRDTLTTKFERTDVDEFGVDLLETCDLFEDVSLEVVEQKGDKLRLCFKAPRDVRIFRGDLYERVINEEIDNHLTISNSEAIDTHDAIAAYTR